MQIFLAKNKAAVKKLTTALLDLFIYFFTTYTISCHCSFPHTDAEIPRS